MSLKMETIVLCFPVSARHVESIRAASANAQIIVSEQDRIAEDILEATIFCGHAKVPINWEKVVQKGQLKWIQSTAAGLDHCLVPSVVNSPITVSGSSGIFSRQVAEHTVALLLGLLRNLSAFFAAQQCKVYERLATDELQGKRIGILGFGGNGRRIAEYLRPMGVTMTATDYYHDSMQCEGVKLISPAQSDHVFSESDIVIVALPLLDSTRLSIGRKQFDLMPRGSHFVNVGRGQLIDEAALVATLRSGRLAAAALDVAFDEPMPVDNPLWNFQNVLITPHVGAQSQFRVSDTVKLFCDNLTRWQKKITLLNLVDKQLGFPRLEHRIDFNWPNR